MTNRLKASILRQSVAAETEIVQALQRTRNNWTQAAELLGISFRQFRYLMKLRGAAIEARLFSPSVGTSSASSAIEDLMK